MIMEMKQDLSKREEKRTALFMKKAADLEESGYQERDLSMSIVKANVMALFYPVPLIVPLLVAYLLKQPFRLDGFAREYLTAGTSLMVSLIVGSPGRFLPRGTCGRLSSAWQRNC